tara:strand:+ start:123 stop:1205 length:1083 start_codon:yes stop_codon:yes gene_type:complete
MKIRDLYITKTLLTYSLVVLLVWLGIYSFFNFLAELGDIGKKNYTIFKALQYILFQMPQVAYNQASPIILLGCVLGMGHLATTNQLLIFRISGISIMKITWLTVKNALFFVFVLIIIGEVLAPISTSFSENNRSIALGQESLSKNQESFWIRDGDNFINITNNINENFISDITIIEVNLLNKINRIVKSSKASFKGNILELTDSKIYSINDKSLFEGISLKERNNYQKNVTFDQDLISSLEKKPKDLTTYSLLKQIQFLSGNKLKSGIFEVELYKRLVKPFTLIVMILMAMIFIFGSNRDTTLGRKIFFGVALALSFELLSRVGGALALSFDFNPLLSAILPVMIIMIISITLLIRKSKS